MTWYNKLGNKLVIPFIIWR